MRRRASSRRHERARRLLGRWLVVALATGASGLAALAPRAAAQPVPGPVAATPPPSLSGGLADLRLATAVRLALATDPATRAVDVDVSARSGVVTLTPARGTLPAAARDVARRVPGVQALAGEAAAGAPAAVVSEPGISASSTPSSAPMLSGMDAPAGAPAPVEAFHTVAPGETLFRIALRYDTTVEALMRLNRLVSPDIRAGQRLRVR